jgi:hypothetical protein
VRTNQYSRRHVYLSHPLSEDTDACELPLLSRTILEGTWSCSSASSSNATAIASSHLMAPRRVPPGTLGCDLDLARIRSVFFHRELLCSKSAFPRFSVPLDACSRNRTGLLLAVSMEYWQRDEHRGCRPHPASVVAVRSWAGVGSVFSTSAPQAYPNRLRRRQPRRRVAPRMQTHHVGMCSSGSRHLVHCSSKNATRSGRSCSLSRAVIR